MMDDIYNSRILEFAGNIPRIGTLTDADAEAGAHSKLCGSRVKVSWGRPQTTHLAQANPVQQSSRFQALDDQEAAPARGRQGSSSGLGGMRDRVRLFGGSLQFESSPGAGFGITAHFPLSDASPGASP